MNDQPNTENKAGQLTLDIVSDIMCPWCFIGKRRLEEALASVPDIEVDIRWRPFQLDPTLPPEGKDRQAYLNEKFGGSAKAGQIYQRVSEAGASAGITFAFDKIGKAPNTLDAHRLIRWSHSTGLQDSMVEKLFKMYFVDGADLTDRQVLINAAIEVGMKGDLVRGLFDSDADIKETRKEIAQSRQMGVTGVPCFIIDNAYAVSSAQEPRTLVSAFRQVVEQKREDAPYTKG